MNDLKHEVLVLGLGNLLMSDDGLGPHVVNGLKQKKWSSKILILEAGTSVIDYLNEISQSRTIIAVDAILTEGIPGSVYRLTASDIVRLPNDWQNSHGFSLPDVVELARELTGYPTNLIIYGVKPLDLSFGVQLSPVVMKALPGVINEVAKEIENLLSNQRNLYSVL